MIIISLILQTITIARMLSNGGKGAVPQKKLTWLQFFLMSGRTTYLIRSSSLDLAPDLSTSNRISKISKSNRIPNSVGPNRIFGSQYDSRGALNSWFKSNRDSDLPITANLSIVFHPAFSYPVSSCSPVFPSFPFHFLSVSNHACRSLVQWLTHRSLIVT